MGRYVSFVEERTSAISIIEGGTGKSSASEALAALGGVSESALAEALNNTVTVNNPIFNSISNYDIISKGFVVSDTVTFDKDVSSFQKVIVGGPITIAVIGFTENKYSDLIIEVVNGGLFTITMPAVNWILPTTGGVTNSFPLYLLATGREPASLQTDGSDFLLFWSDGTGVVYGKLV